VAVTSPGFVGELMFCASATVGAPALINADAVMGENFRGVAGAPLPSPFVAIVLDSGGNPVADVPVTFTVLRGGGNIDGVTTVARNTNSDGKATVVLTLGLQEGISNNTVSAGFEGMTGAPAIFTASGVVPGPAVDTRVSGIVLDNTDRPIPNATAKIVGTPLQAVTNADGQFSIHGAPVGTITLIVDGSTSTRPETFPFLAFTMTTVSGQDNTVGMPIFIPPLDAANSKVVGGDEEVVLTMTGVPGVAFTIFPHSATFPDGSRVGRMTLTQVHADKVPMPPPYGTAPRIVWTLQPAGVHFDPPIRVQLPNADGIPRGQVIEVFQFDHDIEQFVSVGAARVTEDGSVIISDPGFGITKSGWGGAPPPPPPKTCVDPPAECMVCGADGGAVPAPDGTACSDEGNACTTDTCKGGSCAHDLKVCPECQKCKATDGSCEADTAKNNTACSDGPAACDIDKCQNGTCTHTEVTAIAAGPVPDAPTPGNTNMTADAVTAMTCLQTAVTAAGGTMTIQTRHRSQAYQDHLVEVWDKVNLLAGWTEAECATVAANHAAERATHFPMGAPARGVSNHTNGNAFDATVTLPSGSDVATLATGCNLTRPVAGEPWHFER
jgi:hypothetical protein